jgi:hypothetical protein
VRAIAGEIPIGGKLPIALPGFFPLGHGLSRAVGVGSGRGPMAARGHQPAVAVDRW